MLNISNFCSLFEVGVTLNIACVAIEYAQSYTSVVCNQVFNLEKKIDDACKDCKNSLIDETTIQSLPIITINNLSTETLIPRFVSKRSNLITEIEDSKKSLKNNTANACEVKMMPSICFWSFLYGLVGLFLAGFQSETNFNPNVCIYWMALTALGLLYVIIGWWAGIRISNKSNFFCFPSLRFALITFLFSLLLCLLSFLLNDEIVKELANFCWKYALIFSILLLYVNFLISAIIIWSQARQESNKIDQVIQQLQKKCDDLNKDVEKILGADTIGDMLAADE